MIDDPQVIMTRFFSIIIALTVHEYAHAFVANYMGDPTPARHNRLNLNPLTIIKAYPFGAFIVPLIGSFIGFLVGLAATPVNPHLVDRKYTRRQAERWIAFAGPLSNVILGLVFALIYSTLVYLGENQTIDLESVKPLVDLSSTLVYTNCVLALFNMIPIPPLDGFVILSNSLPRSMSNITAYINQYQNMLIIFVLCFGGEALHPLINRMASLFFMLSRNLVGLFF